MNEQVIEDYVTYHVKSNDHHSPEEEVGTRAGLFFKISESKFNEFRFTPANRFARRIDSNRPALVLGCE